MLLLQHLENLTKGLALATLLVAGCGGHEDVDVAYVQTQSGYTTAKSGLTRAQQGLATYKAGETGAGWTAMNEGMQQATEGAESMRAGFGMMKDVMTCGMSPEQMLGMMDQGMARARQALTDMQATDPAQQAAGMKMMQDEGMPKMESAMQQASAALACVEACSGGNNGGGMM